MLDFRVDTFLCVCRFMNFTHAARELNITQPAVSQHIKYLEDFYCVKLFEQDGKKLLLRITPREKAAGREEMFRLQKAAEALGVPMCRPIAFGSASWVRRVVY